MSDVGCGEEGAEGFVDFVEELTQAVAGAAGSEGVEVGLGEAAGFAGTVAGGERGEDAFGAFLVFVAGGGQIFGLFARVEPKGLSLGVEHCSLSIVIGIETRENPAFALRIGGANDDLERPRERISSLAKTRAPGWDIVTVSGQHDDSEIWAGSLEVEQDTARGDRVFVDFGRHPREVAAPGFHTCLLGGSRSG